MAIINKKQVYLVIIFTKKRLLISLAKTIIGIDVRPLSQKGSMPPASERRDVRGQGE